MNTEVSVAFAAVVMSVFASVHEEGDDTAAAPQPVREEEGGREGHTCRIYVMYDM